MKENNARRKTMNETWDGIVQIVGVGMPFWAHPILAQGTTAPGAGAAQPGVVETGTNYVGGIVQNLSAFVPNLLAAIAILLVGIIIAWVAAGATKGLLKRTRSITKLLIGLRVAKREQMLPKSSNGYLMQFSGSSLPSR
jgi:hypothetical protein